MAARASRSSSQEILSDGNDSNNCNLYDSDVGEMSETSQDVGPRPYRFEPRRVRRNVQPEPKAAFTRQTKVGKLVLENFKMLANSCLHTSNSRQITTHAKFATWPT